jgi:release factor glutamine methyltransferase
MSTYRELYTEGRNKLLAAGIDNAEGDARSLLLYASGMSLNQLLLSYEDEIGGTSTAAGVTDEDGYQGVQEKYLDMIDRRCAHVPLQYITHVQNFCGYDMYVDEHVLIPRQDTEILVEKVLDKCRRREPESREDSGISGGSRQGYSVSGQKDVRTLLDLCTGSGCIAIALSLLGDFGEVYASDISEGALEVANYNAETNGAHVTFLKSDMFQGVDGDIKYDVIVSNPPYIPDAQVDALDEEVRNNEPRLALAGDADGLYFYRKIAREAGGYLKDGGRLFLEIGCDQGEAVSMLLRDAQAYRGHYENIEITKDLAGLDRVISAIWRRTDA